MEQVAPGVQLIQIWSGYRLNAYLLGDVLVDTGTKRDAGRLLRAIADVDVGMVALTHAHPDHQGSAQAICKARNLPLACPALDADAMQGNAPLPPTHPLGRMLVPVLAGPRHKVNRVLSNGDKIAGFTVVHAPGHTPGHSFFWRETDGILIAGDVLANMSVVLGTTGLREPPHVFSTDWRLNRQSIACILEMNPRIVCFGHGPPLRDLELLRQFCEARGL